MSSQAVILNGPSGLVSVIDGHPQVQPPLELSGKGLVVFDPLLPASAMVTVVLGAVTGILTVAPGSSQVRVASNNTPWPVLTGTIAQIQALFDGVGGASIRHRLSLPAGREVAGDTITITLADNGVVDGTNNVASMVLDIIAL